MCFVCHYVHLVMAFFIYVSVTTSFVCICRNISVHWMHAAHLVGRIRGNTHWNHKSKWCTSESQLCCCTSAMCQRQQVAGTHYTFLASLTSGHVHYILIDALPIHKAMLFFSVQVQWSSPRPTQLPLMCVELAISPSGVSMRAWRECHLWFG